MKDNTEQFTAKGTLYFLFQKYTLITNDQSLALASYKATAVGKPAPISQTADQSGKI